MRDASRALKAFSKVPWLFDAVLAGEDLNGMSGRAFLKACRAGAENGSLPQKNGRRSSFNSKFPKMIRLKIPSSNVRSSFDFRSPAPETILILPLTVAAPRQLSEGDNSRCRVVE